jgi:hypothetical protein
MHGPDHKPQEARIACVTSQSYETHGYHWPDCIAEADHAVGRQGEAEVRDHGLRGVEGPIAQSALRFRRGSQQRTTRCYLDPEKQGTRGTWGSQSISKVIERARQVGADQRSTLLMSANIE